MAKAPDLAKYSIDELKSIIREAQKLIDQKASEEKKQAKKAAEDAAKKHGFSLNDLVDGAASKSSKPKSPPKYRNPANPSQTWSGRGRQPAWIKEALESGRPLEELAI
jgi:DNA-binding protein H-NS